MLRISDLKRGDVVRHTEGRHGYVVTDNFGNRATAVRTVDITNPMEWIRPKDGDLEEEHGGDGSAYIGMLLDVLSNAVHNEYARIAREDGRPAAEEWIAMVQGRVHEIGILPVEGAGKAVKVLAVRRGMKRGACFARAYEKPVPGVGLVHQREVLNQFAGELLNLAEQYGMRDDDEASR